MPAHYPASARGRGHLTTSRHSTPVTSFLAALVQSEEAGNWLSEGRPLFRSLHPCFRASSDRKLYARRAMFLPIPSLPPSADLEVGTCRAQARRYVRPIASPLPGAGPRAHPIFFGTPQNIELTTEAQRAQRNLLLFLSGTLCLCGEDRCAEGTLECGGSTPPLFCASLLVGAHPEVGFRLQRR
jgi:hypothetical protein